MFTKLALLCLSLLALGVTAACGDDSDTLSVPGRLEAMTIHDRLSIQLYWEKANGSPDAILIERSSSGENGPWAQIASIAGEHTTYIDQDGLQNNAAYYYRLKARRSNNESPYSNVASAMATDLPTPPPTQ
jgi:hypothetical protein